MMRFGSSSWFVSTISEAATPYRAASVSSVSVGPTVTTTPVTGGIVRVWPMWRSAFDLRLFAHQTVIIETPNLLAMPVSVSPDRTLYVRIRPLPSATVVSTATGLRIVPSSRNAPDRATASVVSAPLAISTTSRASTVLELEPRPLTPPWGPLWVTPPAAAIRAAGPSPVGPPTGPAAAVVPGALLIAVARRRIPTATAGTARSVPRRDTRDRRSTERAFVTRLVSAAAERGAMARWRDPMSWLMSDSVVVWATRVRAIRAVAEPGRRSRRNRTSSRGRTTRPRRALATARL